MPEKSAAVSLPPTANTPRPHWYCVVRIWNSTARTIITIGPSQSIERPATCQLEGSLAERSKKRACVTMNAVPRQMPITPSVAMNAGRPTRTMSHEETRPANAPTRRPAAALAQSGQPASTKQIPGHDGRKRDDGARREIHAAGDDDDGSTDRGDAVDR